MRKSRDEAPEVAPEKPVKVVPPVRMFKNVSPHKLRKLGGPDCVIRQGEVFREDEVAPEFLAFWLRTRAVQEAR